MPEATVAEWDAFLSQHPDAHLLQTRAWGQLKSGFGWQPVYVIAGETGAQVLLRRLPLGLHVAYIPRGPLGDPQAGAAPSAGGEDLPDWQSFWPDLDRVLRRHGAFMLKVEPDLWEPPDFPAQERSRRLPAGFRQAEQDIQPARTLLVDLRGTEDQILERMKQKTRYNIRLAAKKGVQVSASQDIETFHRLMQITGQRDRFGVHSLEYYRQAFGLFHPTGQCELLIATYQNEPLAAIMVFARGRRAWYLYGASSEAHRERMPAYLLQWEGMRWARARGCEWYDLWGVPDADEPALEAAFLQRSDGLWGVYRFKRGFGGQLRRGRGPWDRVYQPLPYALYRWWTGRGSEEQTGAAG